VLRAGGAPRAIPLGTAAAIDGAVRAVRREIARERDSEGHSAKLNEAAYRRAGETLRRIVWDPIAPSLAAASAVYVVPDGALQLVNLQALPVGTSQYLAESGPLLHVLSTERDLAEGATASAVSAQGTVSARSAGPLLAVGNPAYDSGAGRAAVAERVASSLYRGPRTACGEFARLRFNALPGTAREIADLAAIWKSKGWTAETLLRAHATEGAVKRQSAGARVLHIATHGFFLDDGCDGTAPLSENPLLRSGLALAAANRRDTAVTGADDGILTAEEAASLDLSGAEWVVLSGCDTGLGDLHAGEGVLGLRRAFQEAGAAAVIGSLWPVEDAAAAQWMSALYRAHFVRGLTTAQSVRACNRAALAARRAKGPARIRSIGRVFLPSSASSRAASDPICLTCGCRSVTQTL
jgi:CHAT domain-containing protein